MKSDTKCHGTETYDGTEHYCGGRRSLSALSIFAILGSRPHGKGSWCPSDNGLFDGIEGISVAGDLSPDPFDPFTGARGSGPAVSDPATCHSAKIDSGGAAGG